jgi:2-methylisocitrate lyase-like PEP mutase family enzyme
MDPSHKAKRFASLHAKGKPLILYNAWDAGSAKTIVDAGAQAIGTSSWSVAAAQGYADGEDLPKNLALEIAARIASIVDVPVTLDFEGGYTDNDIELADSIKRVLEHGIVGINFEDRVVKGEGLYGTPRQAKRIAAIRKAADEAGIPLFINARTDLFLGRSSGPAEATSAALLRGPAYVDAGASGFFVPGVTDEQQIATIAGHVAVPVNVMMFDGVPSVKRLTELGVARISYGPIPYIFVTKALREEAAKLFA